MTISAHHEIVALLMLHLGAKDEGAAKPLSTREWNDLARWLSEHHRATEDLLHDPVMNVLEDWDHPRIPLDRLNRLLDRRSILSLQVEAWLGQGLRLVGRSDETYPRRLLTRLGHGAPPFLFMAGETELLCNEGLAIVGSRRARDEDLLLARSYGEVASQRGLTVVSGGAKGIDSAATDSALEAGGTAVSVPSDSILRKTQSPKTQSHIQDGTLLLLTPFRPDAGFHPGNAMSRNKLVYCLAEAAVVVAAESGKGGTYAGAMEAINAQWIPVGILPSSAPGSGSSMLVERGGIALSSNPTDDMDRLLPGRIAPDHTTHPAITPIAQSPG